MPRAGPSIIPALPEVKRGRGRPRKNRDNLEDGMKLWTLRCLRSPDLVDRYRFLMPTILLGIWHVSIDACAPFFIAGRIVVAMS